MLRSLYSGISGLRAHQTMLDVAGNNIANVNTTGFKSSAARFQDTLSQMLNGAGAPGATTGGTNPAQIGLGVQVASISDNFVQGAPQMTGRGTDLMISGDGFFAVRSGGETLYTRNGAFDFDADGQLVTADGGLVLGWAAVNGVINDAGATGPIVMPTSALTPAIATTTSTFTGNLPNEVADGTALVRDITVYDADGAATVLTLTFTKDPTGWVVNDGTADIGTMEFTAGALTAGGTLTTTGGITLNLTAVSGFAGMNTIAEHNQDGRAAGALESYSIGADGTIFGSYSNGVIEPVARIAIATFGNPVGLEKAGGTLYRQSANTGPAVLGTAGTPGIGQIVGGYLEMSNVDLSQEFTNLIVAQRGFQANARIITTSDEVLQELTNLKR